MRHKDHLTKTDSPMSVMNLALLLLSIGFVSCSRNDNESVRLEDIAANEEVLAFMRTFDGRGALSDSSHATPPGDALHAFRYPSDINLELVVAEPEVTQPVFIDFDHRGRLWVVQYNQYPYPKGLKVTSMDQHIRATFDNVPLPPGEGAKGADKITFFEDTDHDGVFDKCTDAITGLNIATSVALGREKIWVLSPPYLVAYPDLDDDGLPDGEPEVHLRGFGLEDTHAVANSLRWGPDGWLYGAQGSTCTANVSSAVSKNIQFEGQAIWRYHPATHVFEVFAEGGGNTFDVEIDAKGRLYSGDNGVSRGQYYKQGAYYVRNFGKHGALTNPYSFGHLANMDLQGEKVRFTHAFIKYEGAALSPRYEGRMMAVNPLQGYVQLSRFEQNGSTFRIVDEERILETDDKWFRPVDITLGPDGAVYVVDWYDSRLSHVDPRDTWSKKDGRIYRLTNTKAARPRAFDLAKLAGPQLIELLDHKNRWFRQQALRVLGDRADSLLVPPLMERLKSEDGQRALEALWAVHASGGFTPDVASFALQHHDPFVRMWATRLIGDGEVDAVLMREALQRLAARERHPEVRSQLAASAKRLPAGVALPVVEAMIRHHDDSGDPDLPLQLWWALESKAQTHADAIVTLFEDKALWKVQTVRHHLLSRLMQRFIMTGDSAGYAACARLISLAASASEVKVLVNGLHEGLRGADMVELPPTLTAALKPYQDQLGGQALALALRQRDDRATTAALEVVADAKAPIGERLQYTKIFGEISEPRAVPTLLAIVESNQSSPALKQSALQALQRYDQIEIGERVVRAYPDKLRADPGVRMAALSLFSTRPSWAMHLLNAIDRNKLPGEKFIAHTISKNDVPEAIVRQIKTLNDPSVNESATRIWPDVRLASNSEKNDRIAHVSRALQSGRGEPAAGKMIFTRSCGPCHRLFNDGGSLGPDLTGYDRRNINDLLTNIVDPGAYIREGYATYKIKTTDGRTLTATVEDRSGKTLTLNLVSGEKILLPESEVAEMQTQPSLMPDNLLDDLTDQELRDLFSYIAQQR